MNFILSCIILVGLTRVTFPSEYNFQFTTNISIYPKSPTKFLFNISDTKYVIKNAGSVELSCGAKLGESLKWYKPAQVHIYTGEGLRIKNLTKFDYGIYYCARGSSKSEVINVTKVILIPQKTIQRERPIDKDVKYIENVMPKGKEIHYVPDEVKNVSDIVTWENPPGTILLNQGREFYIQSYNVNHTESFFYYRINRNGDCLINKVGKIFISERKKKNVEISVEGFVYYGAKIKLICPPSFYSGSKTKVIWSRNNKVLHQGNAYIIKRYQRESFGVYSCEIQKKGIQVKKNYINLTPAKDLQTRIEMNEETRFYNFYTGKPKELYCKLLREGGVLKYKAKDVIWTFQGQYIDTIKLVSTPEGLKRISRMDFRTASILVINNMDEDNEGTYKCFQGFSTLTVNLLMERSDIFLTLTPEVETVTDNLKQVVEFSCHIDTPGLSSKLIKWYFKPIKSNKENHLPKEVQVVQHPSMSTSFITIENVLKRHEGIYICQVFEKKVTGKLTIIVPTVTTVKPRKLSSKPFQKKRFLCQWSVVDGRNLLNKKESEINGSDSSFLKEKEMITEDDDKVYECSVNNKLEEQIEVAKIRKNQILASLTNLKNALKEMKHVSKEREKQLKQHTKDIQDLQKENIQNKIDKQKLKNEIKLLKEVIDKRRCEKPNNISEWIGLNKLCSNINIDFIWKIKRISNTISQFNMTNPFYLDNYKLRLSFYNFANGDISLGYVIMKGEYDDKLEWPMRLEITLSLVDHVTFEPYNSLTLSYDTYQYSEAFGRPSNETNSRGIGGYPFIKYSVLKDRPTVAYNDLWVVSLVVTRH